jgi:hypothetical protein
MPMTAMVACLKHLAWVPWVSSQGKNSKQNFYRCCRHYHETLWSKIWPMDRNTLGKNKSFVFNADWQIFVTQSPVMLPTTAMVVLLQILCLGTLGDRTQIPLFLYVPSHPR